MARKTHCPHQRTVSVTLKKDPCACCKEMGHWKNECPNRKPTALELEESVTEGHETQPPLCTLGNSEGRGKTNRFFRWTLVHTFHFKTITGAIVRLKNTGTRGNRHQALSVDNLKKGGLGNEMGNSLFNGHPRMPIPSAGERYPHQNGSQNPFWLRENGNAG